MHMTGGNSILTVSSEHLPGLVALAVFPLVACLAVLGIRSLASRGVAWAGSTNARHDSLPVTRKLTLFALALGAVVHAAIVPTHWGDEHLVAAFFIVDTLGFLAAGVWTFIGSAFWRPAALIMLGGTTVVYATYILSGWESADIVGVVTTTVELAAALVLLVPARRAQTGEGNAWVIVAAAPVAITGLADGTAPAANPVTAPTSIGSGCLT